MTFIGIDYSKNSPGVCIRDDSGVRFISFTRGTNNLDNPKKKDVGTIQMRSVRESGVEIIFHDLRPPKKMEYSDSEEFKIYDAVALAQLVVDNLPDDADFVGIEGFSYGARGNAVLDIAGYGYAIRGALLKKYGRNKLGIFAPSAVKKCGGKGNAGKPEMMEYFMASQDLVLQATGFWQGLKEEKFDKVLKPVDDLVDSYWVQECTRKVYEERLTHVK